MMLNHQSILNHILDTKIIAIARLDSGEQLIKTAEVLASEGIDVIEFTVPTPGALEMIARSVKQFGSRVVLGAGTVLDPETARAAILAGASFIVTPTFNLDTIALCKRYGVPIIAGALTPTEILTAWQAGADLVKVFPASLGGPAYIKAVLAPLPQVRLAPTGGVDAGNAGEYVRLGVSALGIGGNLVNKAAIRRRDWDVIRVEARALKAAVQEVSQ
jgi:2-dehydro-3-deoxyphosphogluconate aldolase/(4S)-4-hydroxy-2-oxoglutarate aldolase